MFCLKADLRKLDAGRESHLVLHSPPSPTGSMKQPGGISPPARRQISRAQFQPFRVGLFEFAVRSLVTKGLCLRWL